MQVVLGTIRHIMYIQPLEEIAFNSKLGMMKNNKHLRWLSVRIY